jgi:hypothetical protein
VHVERRRKKTTDGAPNGSAFRNQRKGKEGSQETKHGINEASKTRPEKEVWKPETL